MRSLPLCTGNVRALAQFRQPRVGLDQIIAVTFRMRRGEADAFQAVNLVHGFEQLDEGAILPSLATGNDPRLP